MYRRLILPWLMMTLFFCGIVHAQKMPRENVGNAALFLASKASNFVNGHILYVDGGILANFGYVKGENEIGE